MANIRRARLDDLFAVQHCNLLCLPENYQMRTHMQHLLFFPNLLYVAEDHDGTIVGYVLAKVHEEVERRQRHSKRGQARLQRYGHVTSLAVLPTHRKLGIAKRLMALAHDTLCDTYKVEYSSLNVRVSNEAAHHLYVRSLGYEVFNTDTKYYADHENAYEMRRYFYRRRMNAGSGGGSGGTRQADEGEESEGGRGDDRNAVAAPA